MIYKLIILVASIFMIYEFTKSRSTAIASIEPKANAWISVARQGDNVPYEKPCKNMVSGIRGNVCLDNWKPYGDDNRSSPIPDLSWLKLNGV